MVLRTSDFLALRRIEGALFQNATLVSLLTDSSEPNFSCLVGSECHHKLHYIGLAV